MKLTATQIANLEAKGFKRWTKHGKDRMYIDCTEYGAVIDYYKTGNVSHATFCGERISNADARRLLGTKAYIDVETGELHIRSEYRYTEEIEAAIRKIMDECLEPEPEPEVQTVCTVYKELFTYRRSYSGDPVPEGHPDLEHVADFDSIEEAIECAREAARADGYYEIDDTGFGKIVLKTHNYTAGTRTIDEYGYMVEWDGVDSFESAPSEIIAALEAYGNDLRSWLVYDGCDED